MDALVHAIRGEVLAHLLEQHRQAEEPQYLLCTDGWRYDIAGIIDIDALARAIVDSEPFQDVMRG